MNKKGTITKIFDIVVGKTKADKEWSKVSFLIETSEEYNNLYHFDLFAIDNDDGEDSKVANFIKFNKVGDAVDVSFNVKTAEFKGKYYTNLSAWMVKKDDTTSAPEVDSAPDEDDDLPF